MIDVVAMTILWILSSVSDLREYQIPNDLILAGWLAALVCRLYIQGIYGMGAGICCIVAGILVLLPVYGVHGMGAGDIKLLCALGGIMGPRTVAECIFYSLLAGAGISMAILISTGGIRRRFLYLYQYMNEFYCTGEIRPYYRKGMSFPENFHFTVPIFLSAVLYAGGVY